MTKADCDAARAAVIRARELRKDITNMRAADADPEEIWSVAAEIAELERSAAAVAAEIQRVEDPINRRMLYLRFIEAQTWTMVAAGLGSGSSPESCRVLVYKYFKAHDGET